MSPHTKSSAESAAAAHAVQIAGTASQARAAGARRPAL